MNGKEVDVKEEDDDVLSSFISSQLYKLHEQLHAQQPQQRDVRSSVSRSNVMNGERVDTMEEDVLSSFISSQLHNGQSTEQRDVSFNVLCTNVMNGGQVDVDDVLSNLTSSQLRNAGHEMFRGADVQQTYDTERVRVYNSMYRNSTSQEAHTADKPQERSARRATYMGTFMEFIRGSDYSRTRDMHFNAASGGTHDDGWTFRDSRQIAAAGRHTVDRYNELPTPFRCHVCHMKFHNAENLKSHMYVHTQIFTYDTCHTSPSDMRQLEVHERARSAQLSCDGCSKSFASSSALAAHMYSHTGKPYKCDVCNKAFRESACLTRHKHVHSKPFVCHVCKKAYDVIGKLQGHMHTHYRPCSFCGKVCRSHNVLLAHESLCRTRAAETNHT